MRRKPVRPYTVGRTRNTHVVWPVADASDRLDVDMDELVDPDGLGGEGTDTVSTERVLAAPRTPSKPEREEHDVSHVPYRPWCRFCFIGRGLERPHLTQSGDRNDGYLSGDSSPLPVAKDRRTGCQEVTARTDGEPSICELIRRVRELRAEGTTTADEISHLHHRRPCENDEGCR